MCFAQHLSKNWARERQSNSAYDKSWAATSCIPHAQRSLCNAAFSVSPLAGLFLVSTRGRTCAGERGECPLTPGMFCSAYKQKLGTQQRHNFGTAVQRASACALQSLQRCFLCSAACRLSLSQHTGPSTLGERGRVPLSPGVFCSASKQKLGTRATV